MLESPPSDPTALASATRLAFELQREKQVLHSAWSGICCCTIVVSSAVDEFRGIPVHGVPFATSPCGDSVLCFKRLNAVRSTELCTRKGASRESSRLMNLSAAARFRRCRASHRPQ